MRKVFPICRQYLMLCICEGKLHRGDTLTCFNSSAVIFQVEMEEKAVVGGINISKNTEA